MTMARKANIPRAFRARLTAGKDNLTFGVLICFNTDEGSSTLRTERGIHMSEKLKLQLFGEGGGGAAAAPAGGDGSGEASAVGQGIATGTMSDGTRIDQRLAERMREQERRQPGLYNSVRQAQAQAAQPVAQQQPDVGPEQTAQNIDAEWEEAKKTKFRDQYGRDVQAAVQQRFKNQNDANDTLQILAPMLQSMAKRAGLDPSDTKGLVDAYLDDDSTWEEEAEEHGMTGQAYREFQQLQTENQRYRQQREEQERFEATQKHYASLVQQGEELKKTFPNFDLQEELKNPQFLSMTSPEGRLNVEQAYMALHYRDVLPGAVQAGVQQAQKQMAQTLAANRARPVEGALTNQAAANINADPSNFTREQMRAYIERARMGERITEFR